MGDYKFLILTLCVLSVGACSTSPKQISDGGHGFITVNAIPWGDVYVDGKSLGSTPVVKYPIKPGNHELLIEQIKYKTHEQVISVSRSQTTVLSIKLTDLRKKNQ